MIKQVDDEFVEGEMLTKRDVKLIRLVTRSAKSLVRC